MTPATTIEEMTKTMRQHYGVHVSHVGEDGEMIALGHHDTRRVIAAMNREARVHTFLTNMCDYFGIFYRDVADDLEQLHARLVTACDEAEQPNHDDDCGECAEIRKSDWFIRWDATPDDPAAFPITAWTP
jgi:hypothetical protein